MLYFKESLAMNKVLFGGTIGTDAVFLTKEFKVCRNKEVC